MNRQLDADLARWEAGGLGLDELEARYPGGHVRALADLQARLAAFARVEPPDGGLSWERLRARLPERSPVAVASPYRLRRRLAVAVAAALLGIPGVAYGLAPDAVHDAIDRVTKLWSDDPIQNPAPGEMPRNPAPADPPPATPGDTNENGEPAGNEQPSGDQDARGTGDNGDNHDDPDQPQDDTSGQSGTNGPQTSDSTSDDGQQDQDQGGDQQDVTVDE